jgi:hypothetical protein
LYPATRSIPEVLESIPFTKKADVFVGENVIGFLKTIHLYPNIVIIYC